ncbi:penicillin acylase family protein [Psychrobium sp. nBUS_13]|uniref:penicillin acylase family protein n=1 Tax=Psychrobium sp. nBUS_13 TaxID=3395319 RepID=UPI003EBDDACB
MSIFKSRKIKLPTSAPIELVIFRNEHGVMNVKAPSLGSLLWGSGYAHANDRYTQLLLMRIIGQGRLCELLEDTQVNLEIDTFFRKANWHNNVTDEIDKLAPYTKSMCQHYCDGVNEGIKQKNWSMLKALGYKHEPWTIEDSILISRMTGYITLAQSQTEIEHFFVECVQAGIEIDLLKELFPLSKQDIDLDLLSKISLENSIIPSHVLWNSVLPRMMASNNWVISGNKTQSGKAMLANDPHLEVNRLPNVWCEQLLEYGENRVKGLGMPGLPGAVIGRSNDLAWGVTYAFMDSVDSWIEDCKSGQYLRDGIRCDFQIREEIIKRKKSADHLVTFYDNHHGVLSGDPCVDGYYLSTKWSGAQSGAASLNAAIKMFTVDDTRAALATLGQVESAWNWVVCDKKGDIGYQMSGLMPLRTNGWNGFTPQLGWYSENDWQGFVDAKELPRSYNPESNYIVTANQDLNHLGNFSPINMPMGDYRAQRIADLIEEEPQHDISSNQKIQLDVHSKQARQFLDILLPLLRVAHGNHALFIILENWDCCYDLKSKGAVVFEAFYSELRHIVFANKNYGFSNKVGSYLTQETGIFIDFYQQFDQVLLNNDSAWYQGASQEECFESAFLNIEQHCLKPSWGEENKLSFVNILLGEKLPQWMGATTSPISLRGGRATPSQGQIYRSANRQTSFAPTIRVVTQMNDSVLHTSVAGGPSDNFLSPWYRSELKAWQNGQYKKLI